MVGDSEAVTMNNQAKGTEIDKVRSAFQIIWLKIAS